MLPDPYYLNKEKGIVIYCGDSYSLRSSIPSSRISLLLSDPPYGIDIDPRKYNKTAGFEKIQGDSNDFDPTPWLEMSRRVVLWGANNFCHLIDMKRFVPDDHLPTGGWLLWDKTIDNNVKVVISHGEMAWTNCFRGIRMYRHLWSGAYRDSENGYHVHPTQKPVILMRWILDMFTNAGDLVFDPFMGSGPVARACYEMGRKYVGIEVNEEYCSKAVDRLSLTTLFEA